MSERSAPLKISDQSHKKQLGAFYTPEELAYLLCRWAIRTSNDFILEPSFGACGFLEASRDRLRELNNPNPIKQLFGCDIDDQAFSSYLLPKFPDVAPRQQFLKADFLSLTPDQFIISSFDTVIGNPPYVSHHNMSAKQKANAFNLPLCLDVAIGKKASLWAYFVCHGLRFLKPGGRIAWVLPSSFIYADYASNVRSVVSSNFDRCLAIEVGSRVFLEEGTEEKTVVLLAEGWGQKNKTGKFAIQFAKSLKELGMIINKWGENRLRARNVAQSEKPYLLPTAIKKSIKQVCDTFPTQKIGDIANVLIGIVTGDNKFFILDGNKANELGLPPEALRPILAKFGHSKGLRLSEADLDHLAQKHRCLLINTATMQPGDSLNTYLETFPLEKKHANKTFQKRTIWHQPDDGRTPDAFFPYMNDYGPRLLLNEVSTTCTNTVHRVFFSSSPTLFSPVVTDVQKKALAISLLSTFSQLSAEIEGRSYGSGVLKHEPSEAKRILFVDKSNAPEKEVHKTFDLLDRLLREGKLDDARKEADVFVFGHRFMSDNQSLVETLHLSLDELRNKRRRP